MKNGIIFFAAIPLLATPVHVSAQNLGAVATPTCASGAPALSLGFAYFLRATAITGATAGSGATGRTPYSGAISRVDGPFPEEPLIGNVDENGPVANRLQDGDRIARVNGYPVTTIEGTQALRNAKPGQSIVLTIRRGDNLFPLSVTPGGWRCPLIREGFAPATTVAGLSIPAAISVTGRAMEPSHTAAGSRAATIAGTLARTPSNAGWLGLGFDCSNCGQRATANGRVWYFSEPPIIYNVDTGSPAYTAGIRRGDVLLQIDGKDIKLPAAGARLGLVKPGETLRLTYKRGSRTHATSLKVATSPVAQRNTLALRSNQLIKSTEELRLSENQSRVKAMLNELERTSANEERVMKQLEANLRKTTGSTTTLRSLKQLQSTQQAQRVRERKMLDEMLRVEQESQRKLDLVVEQVKTAAVEARPYVYMLDSVAFTRSASRDQRLRYSGSVGDTDVEVRGPGSVSVQGDTDDIVIVTSDAVIRVKNRKTRDRNE